MFEWITDPEAWISLATLAALEIVLGVDNIIFISILVGRLPESQRQSGRIVGLGLAMLTRILLLMSLAWMMKLTAPLFTVFNQEISGRDLILLIGGLFLIVKSSGEIKEAINHQDHHESERKNKVSYLGVLIQIAVLDIVFSFRFRDYCGRYGKPPSGYDFGDYYCRWRDDVCGKTNRRFCRYTPNVENSSFSFLGFSGN